MGKYKILMQSSKVLRSRFLLQIVAGLIIVLTAIFTTGIAPSAEEKKAQALAPTAWCFTEDPNFPDGYEYIPAGVNVWVLLSDEFGNEVGQIGGAQVHAQALRNGDNPNNPSSPFFPRTAVDGPGCGQSADGMTDSSGFTNLEPLNCGHNNFAFTVTGGLPSDVRYVGSSVNNGPLNAQDISNLDLENGVVTVIKLYYQPIGQPAPPPPVTVVPPAPVTPVAPPVVVQPQPQPVFVPQPPQQVFVPQPPVIPVQQPVFIPQPVIGQPQPQFIPQPFPIPQPIIIPPAPGPVLTQNQNQNQHQNVTITQAAPPAPVIVQQPQVVSVPAPKVLPKTGFEAFLGIPVLLGLAWSGRIIKRRFRLI